MRPQQNRRMRGRGGGNNNQNQNRKGPNPLTRNYESNGPDVKIRGSAQQIAEKYATLARDAQSAGDRVMAENYLQHAEHYNRIIMTALAQMPQQQQMRDNRDEDDGDEDGDEGFAPMQQAVEPQQPSRQQPRHEGRGETRGEGRHEPRGDRRNEAHNDGTGPQPVIDGVPAEVVLAQEEEAPARPRARRQEPRAAVEAATAETAEAAPAGEEAAEGEAPRRARRPRRPRVKAEDAAGGEDAPAAAGEEIVTEAAQ
ncbi:MAG: DUF4167 domain-containing protein [Aquamicrobium sp.]|uniref:DUF4167 domain-containing protein n=1 Tax=Aquamicrobium sp. TaxID=1872579 RepID=UPI00349ECD6C|nr:DUF4167 domain-containing protein [Aquamicrobium sp.]